MHGVYSVSTELTDVQVLNHQSTRIYSADKIVMVLDQLHTKQWAPQFPSILAWLVLGGATA